MIYYDHAVSNLQRRAASSDPPQASDRQGRHAIRLAGTGQVTASRAEMIAAASGRARRQLTPALMGVGRSSCR